MGRNKRNGALEVFAIQLFLLMALWTNRSSLQFGHFGRREEAFQAGNMRKVTAHEATITILNPGVSLRTVGTCFGLDPENLVS